MLLAAFGDGDCTGRRGKGLKHAIKELFRDIWNVPNVLTMARLVMIPIFIGEYSYGHTTWALLVFVMASLNDALDGYLARKYNQITNFGKLMDPLADKLMVVSALICHGTHGVIPLSAILIVAVKELLMIVGGAYMFKMGIVVYSNYWGKTATVFFILAMIAGFFHKEFAATGFHLDTILLWISVTLSLCALVVYSVSAWKQLKALRSEKH